MSSLSESVSNMPTSGRAHQENKVRNLSLSAMMTAVVIVLQLLGSAIHFGTFSINLSLVPIVIGAAMLGVSAASWLGFVSAMVILFSGDAAAFLSVNVYGTIATVVLKGTLAGFCSGVVYKLVSRLNKYAAVIMAALICPVVNTGIFLVGARIFFWDTLTVWGNGLGYHNIWSYTVLVLVGANFLVELGVNMILAPAIARILGLSKDRNISRIIYGGFLALVGYGFLIYAFVLLGTQSDGGKLFATYNFKAGLNLTQRYVLTAAFSDLCRLAGLALIVSGLSRRRAEKRESVKD